MTSPTPRTARLPLAVVLSLLVAQAAFAQSQVTDTLETVVVAAARSNMTVAESPQTVLIIDKAQIQQQLTLSSNSSDVLANLIPSYTPSRGKMNGSGETLRGRAPLILIDGIPQSNPIRPTGREAHTIDFAMVERIEVIQGANAINGLGATGGTINIITRRPQDGALNQHLDVQATAPTAQTRAETASYETRYRVDGRSDRLDYLFSASYADQGLHVDGQGRPIGADNIQGDLMTSRSYDVLAKVGYALTDTQRLSLSVNRYRIKNDNDYIGIPGDRARRLPTTSVRGTPEGSAPHNEVVTSGLSYTHDDLAGMQLNALVFNQEFEGLFGAANTSTFQDPLIAPLGRLYDQSRSVASKWGSKVTLSKDDLLDDRLKLTGGFDLLSDTGKQDLYGTGRTYVPESDFRNLSLFVQGEYALLPALALHAGVRREEAELQIDSYRTLWRYNRVDVEGGTLDFSQTLYNAGLVYTPVEGVNVFTSYSEGFGMPDVGRVLRAIDAPGTRVADLDMLEPILTRSIEAGTRIERGAFDADLSYFRSDSDLGTRVVPLNGAFMMSREKTRVQGVDASLGYRPAAGHRLRLSYAYTRGRYDSDNDGRLDARLDGLNVAPNRVIASWSAQWTPRFASFVQAQHAFSQSFDDPDQRFSGYSLVDATVTYALPRGALRMGVANLFDKQYITYYSQSALVEPLRYFAGRGRTLTLGYSLDF
ncbi:TonB-dependent receptor [Xanthomonas melonis]|uniref:TonB-dependent receptor n=1 Tax=Xanthomonas melonis TaxID=56456 RepID=A0ABS8NZ06_9XANT|nr:TonB-dependent receptor [Xanthomonas melonis]MCD0247286.1 TonB-dependent receptor [Xanthomonas melonis]MCD0259759.1 TonB-dependent receptor [Xanthomonas melonis]MCD0268336.1 TonB-dependent receptor [Xanthomonas melonis]